jgi:aryl-alcohol dehydrogenase-like predicted oxidoreductase
VRTRRLGALEVSAIGVGGNQFGVTMDDAAVAAVVGTALDSGISLFDVADEYGEGAAEQTLGRALGRRRDEAIIATKLGAELPSVSGSGGASPAWIRSAVEDSLRRLATDRIDLLQLHYPDPTVPIEQTLIAFAELVTAGKVREIGCANFTAGQLIAANGAAGPIGVRPFASTQCHLNLIRQRALDDVVPAATDLGMAILPYWPLASGLLTGKYRAGEPAPAGTRLDRYPDAAAGLLHAGNLGRVAALTELAADHGTSLMGLAVGWLLDDVGVASVIAGATRPDQVRVNAALGAGPALPGELLAAAAELGRTKPAS